MANAHAHDHGTSNILRHARRVMGCLERGRDGWSMRWQAGLAIVDLAILAFFLLGPYLRAGSSYMILDYAIAGWVALELISRGLAAGSLREFLRKPMTWIDLAILATLLVPQTLANFAFLRVMRIWTISRSPLAKALLKRYGCGRYEDLVKAAVNFAVFLFMVTGFVYTTFFYHQEGGHGFVNALYYTVTTMTTTGYGDLTLPGPLGKLTSIVTMIIGITLFVRLAHTVVRPFKVAFQCTECGLQRHDVDAVHCKACGHLLNLPNDND
ncbi:ion channel [Rhizobium sp. BK176]|uniref:ion channel n=1 Tax=Rhizobium sp. BK176 TaxID=2587071 RepID=UPI002A4B03B2|nr:voltage-gated potassium channel [Rhizobium sp. BK176]